jgi:putative dimethyl sulfoxide reductase chaperone
MLTGLAFEPQPPTAPIALEPTPDELREECIARAHIYRLLCAAFVEEPTGAFLDALRGPESLAALADAGLAFDEDFLATETPVLADQLACEFTTLFAASGGFPPVESVRLTGRYQQEPYFRVKQGYRQAGFLLGKGRFAVVEDQLGVELMFVAELLDRCAAALDGDDRAAYQRWEREIKRFWAQHPGLWVRGFGSLVARASEHSFYREMGKLLQAFAEAELALLRLRVEDVDQGKAVVPKAEVQVEFNPDEPVCNGCGAGDALRELRT